MVNILQKGSNDFCTSESRKQLVFSCFLPMRGLKREMLVILPAVNLSSRIVDIVVSLPLLGAWAQRLPF